VTHDHDSIAVGSGFGGSVAALRLREKGYSVGVLECGRRFYEGPQRTGLAGWEAALAPRCDEADRMLGVVAYDEDDPADLPERWWSTCGRSARPTARTATRSPPRWPSTR
jgi:choline dehydrogenase-like flavoprotein